MVDRAVADEWIARVLGIGGQADPAPNPELAIQLKTLTQDVQSLRVITAIDTAPLVAALGNAIRAVNAGAASAAQLVDRVTADVVAAKSEARRTEAAAANPRGINYRKLNLQWREVRGKVAANLAKIGAVLLARPEVIADPRFGEAKAIIAKMGSFVPSFDERLEDLLDGAIDNPSTVDAKRLMRDASAVIDAYRQELGAASGLLALEAFATADLGVDLKLHTVLDETLISLKQELASAV